MCTRYSTLKGSYCECKGRCLIRMLQLACGILPVDSRIKIIKCLTCEMSKCISTAQACTKCGPRCSPRSWRAELRRLAQSVDRDRGPRHFSCQFLRKVTLVKCPSAFQLRRLAHSLVPGVVLALGLRHFTCKFSYKCLLCNVQTHPDAFRLRRLAQNVVRGLGLRHFTCKFSHRGASCAMSKCISTAQPRTKCGSRSWAPAFFLVIFRQNGFGEMSKCISTAQARTKCGPRCGPRSWSAAFYV